jgi:hypothetical protein
VYDGIVDDIREVLGVSTMIVEVAISVVTMVTSDGLISWYRPGLGLYPGLIPAGL